MNKTKLTWHGEELMHCESCHKKFTNKDDYWYDTKLGFFHEECFTEWCHEHLVQCLVTPKRVKMYGIKWVCDND